EEDALHREARLPRVEETTDRGGCGGAADVRVVRDDHRVAAAELKRDARHVLRRELHDPLARRGLAGERDLVHAWVRYERVAHLGARAVQGIDNARRETRRGDRLDRALCRERRRRRRLQDDRAARREGGAELVREEGEREV